MGVSGSAAALSAGAIGGVVTAVIVIAGLIVFTVFYFVSKDDIINGETPQITDNNIKLESIEQNG